MGVREIELGKYGEQVAAQHLTAAGMQVLDRNWRCEVGELDLVLLDGSTLVFCEVKTRSGTAHGSPLEAVTPVKADRLRRLAERWMEARDRRADDVRLDLVGVLRGRRGAAEVEHVRGVA